MIDEYNQLYENLKKRHVEISENLYNEIKKTQEEMIEKEKNKVRTQKKRITIIMASEVVLERAKNV